MLFSNDLSSLTEVMSIPTPEPTRTHVPIGHGELITMVGNMLDVAAPEFTVTARQFEIIKDGKRMFSSWELTHEDDAAFRMAIGIRNAHDKAFALGVALGKAVIVCSNMMFIGDHTLGRKHTTNIRSDMPGLIYNILRQISETRNVQVAQSAAFQQRALSDTEAHDLVIRAMDRGVYSASQIGKVLGEYRNPKHEEFEARNVWAFENAVTEVLKDANSFEIPARTGSLNRLLVSTLDADDITPSVTLN